MPRRLDEYRSKLRELDDWAPYLKRHSGLPGPRANLELLAAAVEETTAQGARRLAESEDEFVAACGAAGLGRFAIAHPRDTMARLLELASDRRWRVREGVAIGLQRFGRDDMPKLLNQMRTWSDGSAFTQRAVVAALCEPALLKQRQDARDVLAILDRITSSLAASADRRDEGFRVLRQALGYGWSVAAAASPDDAVPYLRKWMRSKDKDVMWIMKSNLGKSRMTPLRGML